MKSLPKTGKNNLRISGINNVRIYTYSVNCKEDRWYINTGSLGCPKGSDIAKAGILEINNGKIKFNAINVKYNVKEIIEEIKKLKFPFYRKILEIFYGCNE